MRTLVHTNQTPLSTVYAWTIQPCKLPADVHFFTHNHMSSPSPVTMGTRGHLRGQATRRNNNMLYRWPIFFVTRGQALTSTLSLCFSLLSLVITSLLDTTSTVNPPVKPSPFTSQNLSQWLVMNNVILREHGLGLHLLQIDIKCKTISFKAGGKPLDCIVSEWVLTQPGAFEASHKLSNTKTHSMGSVFDPERIFIAGDKLCLLYMTLGELKCSYPPRFLLGTHGDQNTSVWVHPCLFPIFSSVLPAIPLPRLSLLPHLWV